MGFTSRLGHGSMFYFEIPVYPSVLALSSSQLDDTLTMHGGFNNSLKTRPSVLEVDLSMEGSNKYSIEGSNKHSPYMLMNVEESKSSGSHSYSYYLGCSLLS